MAVLSSGVKKIMCRKMLPREREQRTAAATTTAANYVENKKNMSLVVFSRLRWLGELWAYGELWDISQCHCTLHTYVVRISLSLSHFPFSTRTLVATIISSPNRSSVIVSEWVARRTLATKCVFIIIFESF